MGTVTAPPEVDVRKEVTTKEELDELRRRLEELRGRASGATSGEALGGKPYGWQDDIDGLAVFLEDLKQVMSFLIKDRVLENQRQLFNDCWEVIEVRINIAIAELRTIDTDDHVLHIRLYNGGLAGFPLKLKLREYWRRITGSPRNHES